MPYEFYKIVHVAGVVWALVALGALCVHQINGGDRGSNRARRLLAMAHGVGLLLALVGGFGLLARMNILSSWPIWVWLKIGLWLLVGGLLALLGRKPGLSRAMWFALPLLAALGAYVANYKPLA